MISAGTLIAIGIAMVVGGWLGRDSREDALAMLRCHLDTARRDLARLTSERDEALALARLAKTTASAATDQSQAADRARKDLLTDLRLLATALAGASPAAGRAVQELVVRHESIHTP